MDIVRFENPNLLYFLILLPLMVAYYLYKFKEGKAAINISSIAGIKRVSKGLKYYLRHLPFVMRLISMALIIVAIARPQSSSDDQTVTTEGVDIVLSLDVSTSMLARDFTPNRLEAAKDVATKFVLDRKSDRIGLTIFAGESFTQSPLTTDHASLINLLNQVDLGVISDGTAIGSGLATSVNRLRDSDSKSKVVILLTDGVNNSGQITPLTAAEAAAALGIKVYTIGVGTIGTAPSPAIDAWGNTTFVNAEVQIDEETLKTIAESTGGRYFRATDNASLKSVYDEINALEKTEIDIEHFTVFSERYSLFVLLAAIIILLEILVRHLYLRQIP